MTRLDKANAAIDAYLVALRNPNGNPVGTASLYVRNVELERHGVIPSSRKLDLWDHCTLWAACVVACGRVREVSRIERQERAVRPDFSLEKGLRKLRKNPLLKQRLEHHIEQILQPTTK